MTVLDATRAAEVSRPRHAVVWIDHRKADVIFFDRHARHETVVKHRDAPRTIHHRAGTWGPGHIVEDAQYLSDVAAELKDAQDVLIVGPSHVKWQLKAYIERRAPEIAKRIIGVETVNHPAQGELLELARRTFAREAKMHSQVRR